MHSYDVIIVGAGPAGSSTAIHLSNLDPRLASRILLIDKAVFPRPKLCAGGITNSADIILGQLGVHVGLPSVPVHKSKLILPTGTLTINQQDQFRVLRRQEFDQQLFRTVREHGIVAQDGEALKTLLIDSTGVSIQTSKD